MIAISTDLFTGILTNKQKLNVINLVYVVDLVDNAEVVDVDAVHVVDVDVVDVVYADVVDVYVVYVVYVDVVYGHVDVVYVDVVNVDENVKVLLQWEVVL